MRFSVLLSLLACVNFWAPPSAFAAGIPPLTVVLQFEQPYSGASTAALEGELKKIFSPTLDINVRLRKEIKPHEEFSGLVFFKLAGSCSMKAYPLGALSDERGPLAMTHVVDGEILSFGEVRCDRVRQAVQRIVGTGSPDSYQSELGVALGRVIAHEIYHMVAKAPAHTQQGAAKRSLTARELTGASLPFPPGVLKLLRENQAPPRP